MNANKMLQYLDEQKRSIQALIAQLDEIQVAFNRQFDDFQARHDAELDRLTASITGQINAISPELRTAIEARLPDERKQIEERRQRVETEYLPSRQQAADDLLNRAQAELAELRGLNPQLNQQEEELKAQKAELEAQLAASNDEIRQKSRGLGVVWHFVAITKVDRERQRIIGRLEVVNGGLYHLRRRWEKKHKETLASQTKLQERWQLESIAVARLQSELEQLSDQVSCEDLARRRAIRYVLDAIKEPLHASDPVLERGLREMIELNIQTDAYHEGLASVGGIIGLLRGIDSGMQAIRQSIQGLDDEQRMHSAYLKPLSFNLPEQVRTFHEQWPSLAQQFADENTIGGHPAEFSAAIKPLVGGPLSEASIEATFHDMGEMLKQATAAW